MPFASHLYELLNLRIGVIILKTLYITLMIRGWLCTVVAKKHDDSQPKSNEKKDDRKDLFRFRFVKVVVKLLII